MEKSALNVAAHSTALEELVQQHAVLLKKKLAKCGQIAAGRAVGVAGLRGGWSAVMCVWRWHCDYFCDDIVLRVRKKDLRGKVCVRELPAPAQEPKVECLQIKLPGVNFFLKLIVRVNALSNSFYGQTCRLYKYRGERGGLGCFPCVGELEANV